MAGGRKLGHPVSAETRAKIALALRGRKPVWTGQPRSQEHCDKLSRALAGRSQPMGEAAHGWKGDGAGFGAKHIWITRRRGTAKTFACQCCESPAREWANVSGDYRRDAKDYIPLCIPCHRRIDGARVVANRAVARAALLTDRHAEA